MKFRLKWRYFSLKYTLWNTCYDGTWILWKHLAPFPVNLQVVSTTKRDPNYAWISIENRENLRIDVPRYFCFASFFKKMSDIIRGAFSWYTSYDSNISLQTSLCSYLSVFSTTNLRITSGYESAPLHTICTKEYDFYCILGCVMHFMWRYSSKKSYLAECAK